MKNNLVSLIILGVLVLGMIGFVAADTQPVQVTIGEQIVIAISPTLLDFGTLSPGNTNIAGSDIVFDATGSNVDVTVTVSDVTEFPFATGLMINGLAPIGQSTTLPCTLDVNNLCTYTQQNWKDSISIPIASPKGVFNGAIVYTVSGPPIV